MTPVTQYPRTNKSNAMKMTLNGIRHRFVLLRLSQTDQMRHDVTVNDVSK